MSFGRRAFLQFAAGAVGGTLLSPIPWKLTDDVAIWSQNWSWRPSPERGEITKVPTVCTFCEGGCGLTAHLVEKRRAILLEGNPSHPVNAGGICPLGASGLQFLYAPSRVAQPMKQSRKRGDPKGFQPISWGDAMKEVTARLAKARTDGKPETVACVTGQRRSSMDRLWQQFFTAFGSPNLFRMPSPSDSGKIAAKLVLGEASPFAFSVENADYILSFSAPLVEGWGAPGRMQAAFLHWRSPSGNGATRIVQVESRCSMTASKADQWIAVNPGTEALLALGIAHVMVKENLFDAEFVRANVFGFEDWTDPQGKKRQGFRSFVLTAPCTPEEVSKGTGVEAAKIRELAKAFASHNNAVAVWGDNQAGTPSNLYHELCYNALNVLKGNFRSGGLVALEPSAPLGGLPEVKLDAVAKRGLENAFVEKATGKKSPSPEGALLTFLDGVAKGAAYPISLLMVHECNPAHSLPENRLYQKALEKIDFVVSYSSYMDETSVQADLILPNHMRLERLDDLEGIPGAPYGYFALSAPILKPQLDTKHTGDILLETGKTLGDPVAASLPWKNYEEFLKERVKGLAASGKGALADRSGVALRKLQPGDALQANFKDAADLWKKLMAGASWYDAPEDPLGRCETASGKLELACQGLQKMGVTAGDDVAYLPHYSPLRPSGDEKEFPLWLVSYRTMFITSGYHPNPPFMTKGIFDFILRGKELLVEINPQTAGSLGLAEGDRAVLKTTQGEEPVAVHLSGAARPGIVYIVHGLGHQAYDEYIQGKGINANNLIEVQVDPVTGLGTVWATRAQLRRV
ncbi:MAG: molybdopterin-dependent oxidoreductase [Deltaproteobacteria bacterium]|nr:molybdopterin-dependent oxidoreductase [Deltaproteobacteria bacterium]